MLIKNPKSKIILDENSMADLFKKKNFSLVFLKAALILQIQKYLLLQMNRPEDLKLHFTDG